MEFLGMYPESNDRSGPKSEISIFVKLSFDMEKDPSLNGY